LIGAESRPTKKLPPFCLTLHVRDGERGFGLTSSIALKIAASIALNIARSDPCEMAFQSSPSQSETRGFKIGG
jgi:hypothetical protein